VIVTQPQADKRTFAFIIHPIDPQRDVGRKFPALGKLPVWLINFLCLFFPPVYISQIEGIRSAETAEEVTGWFVACPLTPQRMMSLPPNIVYRKIIQTGQLAERLGAQILGLGAFTSVVGDGGITVAQNLNIPVTTGDSYTIAVAVQAIEQAAALMGIPIEQSTVAVVGAAGSIGSLCAELLAGQVKEMLLIGRNREKLEPVKHRVELAGCPSVKTTTDMNDLTQAHLIISVSSAIDSIIEPKHLRRGAVICDVARPRDVSRKVVEQRNDVLVIEGGMVEVPGPVDFGFNFGFPPKMAYACMAETIALALDGRFDSFTLGKNIQLSQVHTIDRIAHRHGFKLGGFRSFERAITDNEIASIKAHSQLARPIASSSQVNTVNG
jgi:predicted amino acid dehydrogenase